MVGQGCGELTSICVGGLAAVWDQSPTPSNANLLSYIIYATTAQGDDKGKGQDIALSGPSLFYEFFLQSSVPSNNHQVPEVKTNVPHQSQNYLLYNRCQPPKGQATLIPSSHNSTTQLHYNPLCMLQLTAVRKRFSMCTAEWHGDKWDVAPTTDGFIP